MKFEPERVIREASERDVPLGLQESVRLVRAVEDKLGEAIKRRRLRRLGLTATSVLLVAGGAALAVASMPGPGPSRTTVAGAGALTGGSTSNPSGTLTLPACDPAMLEALASAVNEPLGATRAVVDITLSTRNRARCSLESEPSLSATYRDGESVTIEYKSASSNTPSMPLVIGPYSFAYTSISEPNTCPNNAPQLESVTLTILSGEMTVMSFPLPMCQQPYATYFAIPST